MTLEKCGMPAIGEFTVRTAGGIHKVVSAPFILGFGIASVAAEVTQSISRLRHSRYGLARAEK